MTSERSSLRLVMMGTGPFAVPSFEALRTAGHAIAMVVTRPNPPVKSRRGPPPAPVRTWAESHRLRIFDPTSINDPEAVDAIAAADADLLVVCDYGQILKPEALQTAPLGGINLHGSLLPAYRGAAPVQWAMLSGDAVTGVSVIHMTPRLDGGPILVSRQTEIKDTETAGELENRLAQLGTAATIEAVEMLIRWDGKSTIGSKQDPARVSKAPRLRKSDGEINWNQTARQIDCHVRGMQPWPTAFSHLKLRGDKPPLRVAIKRVKITDQSSEAFAAGELLAGSGLRVASADRAVEIATIQPAGKREMSGEEFLRGHQLQPGMQFG